MLRETVPECKVKLSEMDETDSGSQSHSFYFFYIPLKVSDTNPGTKFVFTTRAQLNRFKSTWSNQDHYSMVEFILKCKKNWYSVRCMTVCVVFSEHLLWLVSVCAWPAMKYFAYHPWSLLFSFNSFWWFVPHHVSFQSLHIEIISRVSKDHRS